MVNPVNILIIDDNYKSLESIILDMECSENVVMVYYDTDFYNPHEKPSDKSTYLHRYIGNSEIILINERANTDNLDYPTLIHELYPDKVLIAIGPVSPGSADFEDERDCWNAIAPMDSENPVGIISEQIARLRN